MTMAAIAPPITVSPGVAILAASEARQMTAPPPWPIICGRTACREDDTRYDRGDRWHDVSRRYLVQKPRTWVAAAATHQDVDGAHFACRGIDHLLDHARVGRIDLPKGNGRVAVLVGE